MARERPLSGRRAVVITVSDRCSRGEQVDLSGPSVSRLLMEAGAVVVECRILPDERPLLAMAMREAAEMAHLVITTGGTGLAARDITPEATLDVCDRIVPGIAELMRTEGARHTLFSALSRSVCGICGSSLVLNLPGSPAGASSSLRVVLPLLKHALDQLGGNTAH